MQSWIGYARHGKEAEVRDAIMAMGITARVALKIEAIRTGKQRWAEGVTSAVLPNFVVVTCTDDQWHQMRTVKHLAPTFRPVAKRIMDKKVTPFLDVADCEYADRKSRIDAGERIAQYQDGDRLMVMAGMMAGELVTFRKMVEAGANGFPEISVGIGTIGGQELLMRVDPLDIRLATPHD